MLFLPLTCQQIFPSKKLHFLINDGVVSCCYCQQSVKSGLWLDPCFSYIKMTNFKYFWYFFLLYGHKSMGFLCERTSERRPAMLTSWRAAVPPCWQAVRAWGWLCSSTALCLAQSRTRESKVAEKKTLKRLLFLPVGTWPASAERQMKLLCETEKGKKGPVYNVAVFFCGGV